jgi:hypothetical protein
MPGGQLVEQRIVGKAICRYGGTDQGSASNYSGSPAAGACAVLSLLRQRKECAEGGQSGLQAGYRKARGCGAAAHQRRAS